MVEDGLTLHQPAGDKLRARRRAVYLSQAELAAKLYVSVRTVIRWEHGEQEPTREHRRRLAAVLGGIPLDYRWEE